MIADTEGGEIMAVSRRFADMCRDVTIGMTDKEVCEQTEIGYATWRKMLDGIVPSEKTILQLSNLGISAEPFLEERARVVGKPVGHDRIMMAALELSGLPQEGKRQIMALYRELLQEQRSEHSNAA
jgi:hypothetical protein